MNGHLNIKNSLMILTPFFIFPWLDLGDGDGSDKSPKRAILGAGLKSYPAIDCTFYSSN